MDVSHLLDSLNDQQRNAVASPAPNLLVLAGAGSGKTRVLVHRIAWLLQAENVSPFAILAVTFTNKAAREMRSRIDELMSQSMGGMWVGTFHGLAHRLLRMHWQEAGLPEDFHILDSDDQLRLIKRLIRSLKIDDDRWPAKQCQWYINAQKDEGLRAGNIEHFDDDYTKTMLEIYAAYETECERGGMIDFGEILLRAHELWLKNPQILQHYQQRFQYVLVDEFQDTNTIQYAWLRVLAGTHNQLMVVGDDDQSIYGWRGARIENIQQFSNDFSDSDIIRLEQRFSVRQAGPFQPGLVQCGHRSAGHRLAVAKINICVAGFCFMDQNIQQAALSARKHVWQITDLNSRPCLPVQPDHLPVSLCNQQAGFVNKAHSPGVGQSRADLVQLVCCGSGPDSASQGWNKRNTKRKPGRFETDHHEHILLGIRERN